MSTYRELTLEEAYQLWKAGLAVEQRYTDVHGGTEVPWSIMDNGWAEGDWDFLRRAPEWKDEFRVEVE